MAFGGAAAGLGPDFACGPLLFLAQVLINFAILALRLPTTKRHSECARKIYLDDALLMYVTTGICQG